MFYWLRPQAMFYIPHVGTSVGAKPLRVSHLYRIVSHAGTSVGTKPLRVSHLYE